MKKIIYTLTREKQQLERIVEEARKRLEIAPKGHLRIMKKRGHVEYYYKSDKSDYRRNDNNEKVRNDKADYNKNINHETVKKKKDGNAIDDGDGKAGNIKTLNAQFSTPKRSQSANGRYMKKQEIALVRSIAQRDYDTHVVKNAEIRIKAIDSFLKKYKTTNIEDVYQKTNPYRKALICASVISDEEYIKQWQVVKYVGKPFADYSQEIFTEKGERVRSKSEKIIADKLYALEVPYRYEYPLVLEGGIKVYPDFTILKMPEREEVYLEHLGLMDDCNYVDNVMYKLSTYEKNQIFLGINLFLTYESGKHTLNTRALDQFIRKLFCGE